MKPWMKWIVVFIGFVPFVGIAQYICKFVVLGLYGITFPIDGIWDFMIAMVSFPMMISGIGFYMYGIIFFLSYSPKPKISSRILLGISTPIMIMGYLPYIIPDTFTPLFPFSGFRLLLDIIMMFGLLYCSFIEVVEQNEFNNENKPESTIGTDQSTKPKKKSILDDPRQRRIIEKMGTVIKVTKPDIEDNENENK